MSVQTRKYFHRIITALCLSVALILSHQISQAKAVNCDDPVLYPPPDATIECLKAQESDLENQLQMSVSATTPLEGQVVSLGKQLSSIQVQITASQKKMNDLAEGITARDEEIKSRYVVFGQRVRKYYKDSLSQFTFTDLMEKIGSSSTLNEFMLNLAYGQRIANQDKDYIVSVTQDVLGLEKDKKQVEDSKTKLAALQAKLDIQKKFFDTEIAKAKSYQSQLQGQIAALSAKQQQLLAAKLGTLNIPLYAYSTQGGCSSDISPYVDPGFGGTKFAIFTYGVPNRVGLNQYGAWGRAKAGQDSNAILRAYYNFDSYQNMNATIKVNDGNGYNTGNIIWSGSLEDYIKRIWEVPDSWTDNNLAALKAQAIAARSYVLAETNNGSKSICANTYCQVFRTNPKGGNWESAVSQTSGQVMVQGGSPIVAYFSSTHGGYVYQSGGTISSRPWLKNAKDTSDGNINSFSDLQSKAYDRESPWFYCDWGGRKQNNNTAWMTSSEMADIVNSILLVQVDSSADPHILQTDNTSDSNMWNPDKVRQELSSHRTPFTTINSASVSVDFGGGVTTQIHFSGDAGSVDFGGDVFKKYFNLRAPANIQVVGPLFNVERR